MKSLIKIILTSVMMIGWGLSMGQVKFALELLPDQSTYLVSLQSDTTVLPPFNITSSVQITIRVPHGEGSNSFTVGNLTNLQPNTSWDDNVQLFSPPESPNWDYISFALISMGTTGITFVEGVKLPLFSFTNEAAACVGDIELIDNETDPFLPPNSNNSNIGHSIVVFGMGLMNAYAGNTDDWTATCVPEVNCNEATVNLSEDICLGDSFEGYFFSQDTTLERHYFSSNNCDSTVITELTVHPEYDIVNNQAICLGEEFNGQIYFNNTTLVANLVSMHGCDSIVTTNLEILPPVFTNLDTTICFGNEFANIIIEADTLLYEVLMAENGCDSIVNTQVTVSTFEFIQKDTTICAGETINGTVFVIDTLIENYLLGYNGCDSLVSHTQVNIIPLSETTTEVLLVEGTAYQNFFPTNDTTIIQNLTGLAGCDSIATTNISVFPPNTTIVDTLVCQGQIIQGQIIQADTVLMDTIANDLIVTNVEVLPTIINETIHTLCYGQTFNGVAFYSDTILTQVFNGNSSCDSVALTNISVSPPIETIIDTSICLNELFNGVLYESDTILTANYISFMGCDSLVTTHLQIINPPINNIEVDICYGELFDNQFFENDTLLIETLIGSNGCDSLVQTFLTVHSLPEPTINGQQAFCKGESIALTTQSFDSYLWSNSSMQSNIEVSESGSYSVTVTDVNGCSGTDELTTIATAIDAEFNAISPSCGKDGSIEFLQVTGGLSPYTYSINGGHSMEQNTVFADLSEDTYELIVEDANGCQWQNAAYLSEMMPLEIDVEQDQVIALGDSVRIPVYINLLNYDSIIWTPTIGLNCADCETPIAKPMETTKYKVKVMSGSGCVAEKSLTLTVEKLTKLYVPNVFSPNNDGENDLFFPLAGNDVQQIKSFRIFNRYGGIVFEQKDFMPNNPTFGWDGKIQGQLLDAGVFIWIIEVEFIDGNTAIKKGDVTILK